MNLFLFILQAMAFGISLLIMVRPCIESRPIRLTHGLAASLFVAFLHSLLLFAGLCVGRQLRFDDSLYHVVNEMVLLGMIVYVAIRWMVTAFRHATASSYDLSRWSTLLAFAVATGVNLLLVGIGAGFVDHRVSLGFSVALPLMIIEFLAFYLAVMMGRQHKSLKERRWYLFAVLLLLSSALLYVVG